MVINLKPDAQLDEHPAPASHTQVICDLREFLQVGPYGCDFIQHHIEWVAKYEFTVSSQESNGADIVLKLWCHHITQTLDRAETFWRGNLLGRFSVRALEGINFSSDLQFIEDY